MPVTSKFPAPAGVPTEPQNVHNLLFRSPAALAQPDYTAHIDARTGQRRTYRELVARIYEGATALGSLLGLGQEHMVGILSPNCMEYIPFYHACLAATVPVAFLPSLATAHELRHALDVSKCTHLFVHADLLELARKSVSGSELPDDRIYLLEGAGDDRRPSFASLIAEVKAKKVQQLGVRKAERDTLAYLIFSSGTSGLPKAVMISHGNLCAAFRLVASLGQQIKAAQKTPPRYPTPEGIPVHLAFLPFYHSLGLKAYAFRLFIGPPATVVILPKWRPDVLGPLVEKYKVTDLFLVPSAMHQLLKSDTFGKSDRKTIMSVMTGGSYLPPDLAARLLKMLPKGAVVRDAYGMSETTYVSIMRPPPGVLGLQPIPNSLGILTHGVTAAVLLPDGREAPTGQTGDLYLHGGNIALGYYNNTGATREAFVEREIGGVSGRWLKTGDRVSVDETGVFYYEDRAKDTLKISGEQVSPAELENTLLAHPRKLIVDACVAGVLTATVRLSDERVPRAWVVLSPAGEALGKAEVVRLLDEWSRERLSKYKWLRGGIEVVDEIPKSVTGKTLRRELQAKYEEKLKLQARL